jgi:hypothetical protein
MTTPRKEPQAAPALAGTEKKSAATVTVACNIPNGIVMQLCKPTTWIEETPSGSRERTRFDKFGKRIVLAGPAYPAGMAPKGFKERPLVAGGYAMTLDVPKAFFDEWLKQNHGAPYVANGQIFAMQTVGDAQAKGREHAENRSGLEPLDQDMNPDKDTRLPRSMSASIDPVRMAEEMKGRPNISA